MQAAPKALGQVPYRPRFPQKESLHPSHQPLPQGKKRVKARGFFFSFLVSASLILTPLAVLNLSLTAMTTKTSYQMERLKEDIRVEKSGQERIKVEIANLTAPERIQKLAIGELSMITPASVHFISMPDGNTSPANYAYLNSEGGGN